MKRFIIFLLFIFLGVNISYAYGEDNSYNNFVTLPEGSFLRATMQRELSTATNKIGDEVRMMATTPTFAGNGIVIPEKSIYIGEIIQINQPIEGINGALKIQINKVIYPSGDEMSLNAMVWSKNNNLLGGEKTMPAYYHKMPHFTFRWGGGCLAFQDSGIYKMGIPTIVKAGTELLIILLEETEFELYEL
ncbi:hypothetical protein J6Q66_08900 [bacterium]|nr:hypothetical protein [bacterium]